MKLQTEKKAIHTALKSIRADDVNSSANAPQAPLTPPQKRTVTTAPSRSAITEVSLPPISTTANSASYQAIIETALKDGFPASENPAQRSVQRSTQRSAQAHTTAVKSFPSVELPSLAQLEAQAKHMNQLSQTQEATLNRLKAIAVQIEQERREAERKKLQAEKLAQSSAVTARSTVKLSLPPATASQTAYQTAQFLRQLQGRAQGRRTSEDGYSEQTVPARKFRRRPALLKRLRRWLFSSSPNRRTPRRPLQNRPHSVRSSSHAAIPQGCGHRCPVASPKSIFTLRETLTLLFGAAAIRLLLNLLLESLPLLTIPVMLLLILPAAIALYKATTAPQFSIIWGYRICVILLGLLIGGRL
ncbi:hypothetical protein [Leptolyngbya ohadii]|uniref:hypothetical protein n=1 Tax=Leptolyngbya ohadii TaxID=1962290 RepID=UPI000B598D06|nr:hypothetical protein [Leptolyngbya ohadii]